jgi:antitoxin VapB
VQADRRREASIEVWLDIYFKVYEEESMPTTDTKQLSQAVRIPAQFRFKGDRVYVRRDPASGDLVLSEKPELSWKEFFAAHRGHGAPEDFLSDREQGNQEDRFLL